MWERLGGVTLALCLISASAAAQPDPDTLARRHFESGVAYLVESDYDNALKAFNKAYELSRRPDLLLNIATVHERTSQLDSAIAALKRYLAVVPKDEEADTVRLRLANLEKRKAEQDRQRAKPTGSGGRRAGPLGGHPDVVDAQQPPNRLPAYVAFGVGGLALTGAVITGIMAQNEHSEVEDRCSPNCTQDDISSGERLALVSTVLTGAAVVGAGVGLVLWFGEEGKVGSAKLRLSGVAHPRGAGARAAFSF